MKMFIARVALVSTFAFGAFLGVGVALDGGQATLTGPQSAAARMQADKWWCGQDLETGERIPCPGREDKGGGY